MNAKITHTEAEYPHLFARGIVAYFIVSTARGKHCMFNRMNDGTTVFVYGSKPSLKVWEFAAGLAV